MAKKIEFPNGRTWLTQRAALDHFKAMLHRYANGAVVDDREDHDDLLGLRGWSHETESEALWRLSDLSSPEPAASLPWVAATSLTGGLA